MEGRIGIGAFGSLYGENGWWPQQLVFFVVLEVLYIYCIFWKIKDYYITHIKNSFFLFLLNFVCFNYIKF